MMTKSPISHWIRERFAIWAIFVFMSAILFSSSNEALRAAGMLATLTLFTTGPKHPVPKNPLYVQYGLALIIVVLAVISLSLAIIPNNFVNEPVIRHVVHHPCLVMPVWISSIGFAYWRRNSEINGDTAGHTQNK
jgi:hypothetical protein